MVVVTEGSLDAVAEHEPQCLPGGIVVDAVEVSRSRRASATRRAHGAQTADGVVVLRDNASCWIGNGGNLADQIVAVGDRVGCGVNQLGYCRDPAEVVV